MKKIAVIGAGFAGLGVSFYLLEKGYKVTLIDEKGIGKGASGIAAGILHPYPGEHVRRTWRASNGLYEARILLEEAQKFSSSPVADYRGVVRKPKHSALAQALEERAEQYDDIKKVGEDTFLITSGISVHCPIYLEALFRALEAKGLMLEIRKVSSYEDVQEYDEVIYCLGYGIREFPLKKKPPLSYRKGQILVGTVEPKEKVPALPTLVDGYMLQEGEVVLYGATYEREFDSILPCVEKAKELLLPKLYLFVPDGQMTEIHECHAGVRVSIRNSHLPVIDKVGEKEWLYTGLGSKGLIYHAYLGKLLAEAIGIGDADSIPKELKIR